MNPEKANRVAIPPEFVVKVLGILSAGSTLYVTDAAVLPETTGAALNVLNSDPPPASTPQP